MISPELLTEFYGNKLIALPVVFDITTKTVKKHPEHDPGKVTLDLQYALSINDGYMNAANGIALKVMPPLGMIDFDLKNTEDKEVYAKWLTEITNRDESILSRVCIERTRNAGYHVYFKYEKLDRKIPLARGANGEEKISIYTGGLLSYCSPSPGYQIIHSSFEEIDFVTAEQYDIMISAAAAYHEDAQPAAGKIQIMDYPPEYESICLQFDAQCTDAIFNQLLNDITLFECKGYRKKKNQHYMPYLRLGSKAEYSAKAYFKSKRLLLFTDSLKKFPTWNDYNPNDKKGKWSLSPAKIIYYKNNQDWTITLEEIQLIADSAGLELKHPEPVAMLPQDRLRFPYDVFPAALQDFIDINIIQHEYLAGGILTAAATALGNSVSIEALDGFVTKPILYVAIVAPPGGFKSPALKAAFAPLERYDSQAYKSHLEKKEQYRRDVAKWQKAKKETEAPTEPTMHQTLIKDSTIEMVIKILSANPDGCCILADELSGFLNRMNQYRQGDEVQKWLELWNGGNVLLQRITREESKVEDSFCNIIGGIQPGVLEAVSSGDNEHNGFYHRFLFIYPTPNPKADWQPLKIPESIKTAFHNYFHDLINTRAQKTRYVLSTDAELIFQPWFNLKNKFYNKANSDAVRGIITKYQEYCLRFAVLIQAMHDVHNRAGYITGKSMERAVRLTEYFLGNMQKALNILAPETPIDSLPEFWKNVYRDLPESFTMRGLGLFLFKRKIKPATFKTWLFRNFGKNTSIFVQIERGSYQKNY